MTNWQSMDLAPRDNSDITIYCEDGSIVTGHWGDYTPGGDDDSDDEWLLATGERIDHAACWTSDPAPYDPLTPAQILEFGL